MAESGGGNSRTGTVMGSRAGERELPPSRHRDRDRGGEGTPGGDTQRPPPGPVIPAMSSAALLLASLLTLATATPPAPPHAAAAGERAHVQVRRVCTVSARSIQYDDCRAVLCPRSIQLSLIHSMTEERRQRPAGLPVIRHGAAQHHHQHHLCRQQQQQ